MPEQITIKKASAKVADDTLYLDSFEERDPEVVNFVAASDDGESAVHRVLQVGARALALAQTSIDTNVVKSEFDGMSREFDGKLDETVEEIGKVTKNLLDKETGDLAEALKEFAGELDELLDETFDEDSKTSALAKVDRLLEEAGKRQVDAVKRVVDPDNPESPLGRHRHEIVRAVKEVGENMSKAVTEVSEKIAVTTVRAELAERTASKGFAFEDLVHEALSRVAVAHGDLAEQVGTVPGVAGNKAGDEVVTLCLDDTRGTTARYVLELKDRKLGQKATFEELDRAMANREASVGIAVFSRAELAPIPGPFAFWGNYAIAVIDKESVDEGALRLACLWARWVVRRQITDDGSDISLDRVAGLIDEARRALDRVSTVRRCHTSATKRINEASHQVDEMSTEVEAVLDAIASEISR
jgi:hypothetical protein